jgi:outer membrane receptor protein involved in Fe transport
VELTPFEVRTERDRGYAASNAISGTRSNVPIAEIPFNIQVVTEEMLNDILAFRPTDSLNYFGAVSTRPFDSQDALQGLTDLFGGARIRGLSSSVNLRNGVRTFDQPLAAMVQRVELVKGPAAVLYGLSEPGGIYNSITKTPLFNRDVTRLSLTAGSFDNYRATFDGNRRLGKNFAARVNGSWARIGTEYSFSKGWESAINGQLAWRPSNKTLVTVEAEYDDRDIGNPEGHRYRFGNSSPSGTTAVTINGVTYASGGLGPQYGTTVRGAQISLYAHPLYRGVDPNFSFSGPDSRRYVNRKTFGVTVAQSVFEGFDLQVQGYHTEREHSNDLQQAGLVTGTTGFHYPTLDPATRRPVFLNRWQRFDNRNVLDSLVLNGVYKFKFDRVLGGVENTANFGYQAFRDYVTQRESVDQTDRRNGRPNDNAALIGGRFEGPPQFNRPAPGIWFNYVEILNPGPNTRPSDLVMSLLPPAAGSFGSPFDSAYQRNFFDSFFATISSKLWNGRLILNGGVYRTDIDFKRGSLPSSISTLVFDDGETLPQAGFVFKIAKPVSVFALYTESLQPNSSQRDFAGNPFAPRKGVGEEAGFKVELWDGKVSGTLSYFNITQTNRVVFDDFAPNPNDPVDGRGANVARGENRSEGFDIDTIISVSRNFQLLLSYARMDVTLEKDPVVELIGQREIGSYKHGYGALGKYQFLEGTLRGASVGLGLNKSSNITAESRTNRFSDSAQALPFYVQREFKGQWDGDFFLSYTRKLFGRNVGFQFNVKNLFERERPIGWDPSAAVNNVAMEPYYYASKRRFFFTTTIDF